MATMYELIEETIAKVAPNCSERDKKSYEDALKKMLLQGVPFDQAAGLTQEIKDTLYAYAYRLYGSGKCKDALLIFSLLSTLDNANPTYSFGVAACRHMLKEYQDALNAYVACYYMDLNNPLPFYHMSDCYLKLNRPDYAAFSLGMVINIAGNEPKYAKIKERAQLTQASLIKGIEQLAAQNQ